MSTTALRVWIVNQFALPPDRAGGTRHWGLAAGLRRHGIETTVIAAPVEYTTGKTFREARGLAAWHENVEDVSFVWVDQKERGAGLAARLASMIRFGATVARGDWTNHLDAPDLVLGSSPSLFGAWGAARLARAQGTPFVLEVRDVWPESIVSVAGISRWHPGVLALGGLERWLYRTADHVVTLLPGAAAHIAARGGEPGAITWVPNGVVLPERVPLAHREAGDPLRVVYAGAHGPANALEAVVEAARHVAGTHGDRVHFTFYGTGPSKPSLVAQAADLPTVTFHDPVSKREVPACLAAGDVLIANMLDIGLYRHGISFNKLFDYLAAARPIVFGTSALNDPIKAAGAGLSVAANDPEALADAVRTLADAPFAEREAMGQRGRAYVEEHHDMDMLAARLAGVLHDLANRAHSTRRQ